MKSLLFISIVLISGASAGLIHGTANLILVEPYLDIAIALENEQLFESGQAPDNAEFWEWYYDYRDWQKAGQLLAGVILGTAVGSLFGIIFSSTRVILPTNNNIKKALVLAGIMWLVLFFIPFLKYPANPPTVGDAQTLEFRTGAYIAVVAISGFGAMSFYQIAKRVKKYQKSIAIGGYAVLMVTVFILMPPNPDEITLDAQLVSEFRLVSVLGVSTFWCSIAVILGGLWQKFKPDDISQTH